MLKDQGLKDRLEKSAKSNTYKDFKFTYDDCVQDALVLGYDQNVDFYTLLLNNADVRGKIANVFMMEIYNLLGGGKNETVLTAYDYPEMAQMVAEPAVPYGADAPVKKHR